MYDDTGNLIKTTINNSNKPTLTMNLSCFEEITL